MFGPEIIKKVLIFIIILLFLVVVVLFTLENARPEVELVGQGAGLLVSSSALFTLFKPDFIAFRRRSSEKGFTLTFELVIAVIVILFTIIGCLQLLGIINIKQTAGFLANLPL